MHQNVVSKKVCTKILFSNNDTVLDFIDSDIARFFGDEIDILTAHLNSIRLDQVKFEDDPETIIHVRLMAWYNSFKQGKAFKKELSKELMLVAWHTKRQWYCCMSGSKNRKKFLHVAWHTKRQWYCCMSGNKNRKKFLHINRVKNKVSQTEL